MTLSNALDSVDLAARGDYKEGLAGFAPVVGVDPVIGLLLAYEFEGPVLTLSHRSRATTVAIYAFGGSEDARAGAR